MTNCWKSCPERSSEEILRLEPKMAAEMNSMTCMWNGEAICMHCPNNHMETIYQIISVMHITKHKVKITKHVQLYFDRRLWQNIFYALGGVLIISKKVQKQHIRFYNKNIMTTHSFRHCTIG